MVSDCQCGKSAVAVVKPFNMEQRIDCVARLNDKVAAATEISPLSNDLLHTRGLQCKRWVACLENKRISHNYCILEQHPIKCFIFLFHDYFLLHDFVLVGAEKHISLRLEIKNAELRRVLTSAAFYISRNIVLANLIFFSYANYAQLVTPFVR